MSNGAGSTRGGQTGHRRPPGKPLSHSLVEDWRMGGWDGGREEGAVEREGDGEGRGVIRGCPEPFEVSRVRV